MKMIHENLGRSAILLAIINMSLGVFYAVFDWYWILIWFCYLGAFVIVYLLFEANIYFSKTSDTLSKSVTSKNEQDDYDDGYDLNMSKSGSTQQLTPGFASETHSQSGVSGIQMQTIRYSTNNSVNNSLRKEKSMNSKYSPSTPPPPYFNKGNKHQAFSTINFNSNSNPQFQSTSSPLPGRKIHPPSQLAYSQDIELDEPLPMSSSTTPRNINENYSSSRIQNANQVYTIQTKYSPNPSLKFNKRETDLSYLSYNNNINSINDQNEMLPQPNRAQKINSNNNYKMNANLRY